MKATDTLYRDAKHMVVVLPSEKQVGIQDSKTAISKDHQFCFTIQWAIFPVVPQKYHVGGVR